MYTSVTYQDWERTPEEMRRGLIRTVISQYKASKDFKLANEATKYFQNDNVAIGNKTIVKATAVETKDENSRRKRRSIIKHDVPGIRVPNGFFFRFVVQQNQFLLANGVILDDNDMKNKLGFGFDKTLERIGEKALQHGVCWGYWNKDHLECIPAADGRDTGFVALLDELSGTPKVGIQFWQIAYGKPMCVRLFEMDGVTVYREVNGELVEQEPKRAYVQMVRRDAFGAELVGATNYDALPVIPLFANEEKKSELTPGIKAKIDMYDKVFSDYGDNLDRANDVYWILNNFGGETSNLLETMEYINTLKIVATNNDNTGGASAKPETVEVPYQARMNALDLLKKSLYQDFMALDMDELTGGSLTNVAIRAATANLNMKADRYEWQVFQFVQNILKLIGIETESISFTRQSIANEQETIENIYLMRQDIDRKTALKLNPMIPNDDIESIMSNMDAEEVAGLPGVAELETAVR